MEQFKLTLSLGSQRPSRHAKEGVRSEKERSEAVEKHREALGKMTRNHWGFAKLATSIDFKNEEEGRREERRASLEEQQRCFETEMRRNRVPTTQSAAKGVSW